jgi:type II secretory pathway component HofQ
MNFNKSILSAAIVASLSFAAQLHAQDTNNAAPTREDATQDATDLDVVTVIGMRDSLEKSLDAKRDSNSHVEVVTAEDIAKLLTEQSLSSQGAGSSGGGGSGGQSQDRGFLSPRGSLSYDKRTNTLLAIDIPQRVANIRNLVQQLDKPVDQVLIEARIVIATESFARELGAKFGIAGNTDNVFYNGNVASNTATADSVPSSSCPRGSCIRRSRWRSTSLRWWRPWRSAVMR